MVCIVTDSTCDIPARRQRELGIEVLPLLVRFGDVSFRDGLDLTAGEFYGRLSQSPVLPTTSQINPDLLRACFQAKLDAGHQVVALFLSSGLSGTYQSALIARDLIGSPDLFVLDSRTTSFGLYLLVEVAVRLRDQGHSGAAIAAELGRLIPRNRLYVAVETMKYLHMGGRISAATAVLGGLLGIHPIITVEDGRAQAVGKARGAKAAMEWIAKRLEQEPNDPDLPVAFGHSARPSAMERCMAFFADRVDTMHAITGEIGSVVGTHVGPGAMGFVYFTKEGTAAL